ncbi:asparagine synthase C-terminal domain-containing protein [Pseudomonas sp. REP124]|uniref:asparagine synthase-related protein n=1 Tax=Pseudomonas sp. REP124 TaxID=2875731 RepID=UPI001CC90273|nr:asparagine synthase-related protein [Pseudomonas sp. REP124]MBZ9784266.1 asparagine synthase C-terminal domain-containing protein [Pseudomonas sp. REP124]
MITCKIDRKSCVGLPSFIDNKYTWPDGSQLSILNNPYISSTIFHDKQRWICIIRVLSHPANKEPKIIPLTPSKLTSIYKDFSSIESESILVEMVTGEHGNVVRIISGNEGSVPIYFCTNNEKIYFSWDFKKIASTRQSVTIDIEYVVKSTFEPIYTNRTAFQGIYMLTAGTSCTFSDSSCDYKFPLESTELRTINSIDPDDAIYEFTNLIKNKMRSQLLNPHKMAIELSGGLDSSTVAIAIAHTFPSSTINTYGIVISDPSLIESQCIRREEVIRHIGARDHIIKIMDHLPSLSSSAEDKYYLNSEADGEAFDSIWAQAAKDGHHLVINGCGGDELFPQFLDEDFTTDRMRSMNDHEWHSYNKILMNRLSPKAQDILSSSLLPCAPRTSAETCLMLAMIRRAPLLLGLNLIPLYPFRDRKIIEFCRNLPTSMRVNKSLLSNFISKTMTKDTFKNYPKENFMHADKLALLRQKETLIALHTKFRIIEIGLIDQKTLMLDLERLNTNTPSHILDYLSNLLSIERFLKAYL